MEIRWHVMPLGPDVSYQDPMSGASWDSLQGYGILCNRMESIRPSPTYSPLAACCFPTCAVGRVSVPDLPTTYCLLLRQVHGGEKVRLLVRRESHAPGETAIT